MLGLFTRFPSMPGLGSLSLWIETQVQGSAGESEVQLEAFRFGVPGGIQQHYPFTPDTHTHLSESNATGEAAVALAL